MSAMRLLVVEDDPALARQLAERLEGEGYAVDRAADGEEGQFLGETEPYDAIVLDLGLPRVDGLTVLRSWRAGGIATPVIILTARGAWTEKVQGIDAGADDYLAKPFSMEELLARIRALIRRSKGHASAEIACGGVVLDTRSGRVTLDGQTVDLTGHEFRVLDYLMHRKGQLVSRTELTEHIYAQDFDRDSNTIEVFVGRLRRKLGADLIKTVRGLGYKLEAP
ncbi:putative two-component transcriptional regulator (plasmid) [Azospirillum baldaniorum]|uniref:Two-component transcriptional regulator n=2 Tax=Azospirillum baldaniorum TaxID=1064539 RepID=A0A9P1JVK0_9PROT|nr:putative two-component transcriptional regulator [Azospirillum baldaniorum]